MIKIENLTKKFGHFSALDDVSLKLSANESVIVTGQNGAGKTTLVRTILGEYVPSFGKIEIQGINPIKNREKVLRNVGFVPQMPPPIKLSVEELIRYAWRSSGADRAKIFEFCVQMELDIKEHIKQIFFKLSGGMKQKLLIAIALSREPDIFIFDEPAANLDPQGREKFYNLISLLKKERLLVFVSHRIEEIKDLVNRKIDMDLGKVINDEKL
jgi:ABC-2 type transport system ATP-binding protein